jgi:hypothetical protein
MVKDTPHTIKNSATQPQIKKHMKSIKLPILFAITASVSMAQTSISSFGALDTASPDSSFAANTEFSTPSIGNTSLIVDFNMTTPSSFATDGGVLLDFGADAKGLSIVMADDRLVYRASNSGNLYVTSTALSTSTSYRVTASLFYDASGDEAVSFYLNEANAVDPSFDSGLNHQPTTATLGDIAGGNDSGYGIVGGGIVLGGTAASPGKLGTNEIDFTGTLDSGLDLYLDSYLTVVPEPSSFGLLCGVLTLGLVMGRRKL